MKWLKRIVLTAVMLLALGAAAVIWQGYQMYSDALAEKPLTEGFVVFFQVMIQG